MVRLIFFSTSMPRQNRNKKTHYEIFRTVNAIFVTDSINLAKRMRVEKRLYDKIIDTLNKEVLKSH